MRMMLAALLLLAALPAYTDSDEEALRHLKLVLWPQAYREQDTELLDRILHDSFQMLDNGGGRSTKKDELEYIENNPWTVESFRYDIERLHIYDGAFAIVDGRGTTDRYTYVSSNYLVKKGGRWQAVSSHVSGYRELDANEIGD